MTKFRFLNSQLQAVLSRKKITTELVTINERSGLSVQKTSRKPGNFQPLPDFPSYAYCSFVGSNYRIQGHFGPPHLHVSELFIERGITQ